MKLPQVLADPAGLGRRASPDDFGGGQGMAAMGQAVSGVGDIAGRLLDVQQTTLVNTAISDSSVALSELETQESRNPDYAGRGARFLKTSKEIRKGFSNGLLPKYQAQFDNNYGPMSARGVSRIRSGAWKDTIDTGKATLDVLGRRFAIDAVAAPPGAQRQEKIDNYYNALDVARGQGLISDQDGVKRSERFIDEVMGGDVRQLISQDPFAAISALDSTDGRFSDLTPETRAIHRAQAVRSYEANLRSAANGIARGMAQDERMRAQAEEKSEVILDGWLEAGDTAAVENWMARPENDGILDSESRRWYRTRIKAGDGLGRSVTNPDTYIALAAMTNMDIGDLRVSGYEPGKGDGSGDDYPTAKPLGRDEMLSSRINAAYRDNRLSRSDRDQLLKAREEHRFGGAEKHLEASLRAGIFSGDAGISKIRAQEALSDFLDWRTDPANRKASRADAMDIARLLVRDGTIVPLDEQPASQLGFSSRLKYVGGDTNRKTRRIDAEASAKALLAARNAGDLTDYEFAYEMNNLTRSRKQESQNITREEEKAARERAANAARK